ncbi:MAG: DNA-processing protein DprA [Thermodesulfobacteriota bacterium]|nr:DNA-processing protein DprA [Thermodesulfobacteriota bacterium]
MNDNDDVFYSIAIQKTAGIGKRSFKRLIQIFGSANKVFSSNSEILDTIPDLKLRNLVSKIKKFNEWDRIEKEIKDANKKGIGIICLSQPEYSKNLKNIPDPPPVLYYKGNFEPSDDLAVAIVGTRMPTKYGLHHAEELSYELSRHEITIISGLARGIDTIAHKGALKSGGRTIAVMGNGLDIIYPEENRELFYQITKNGAIISEFPPSTPPNPYNFPKRNRLISGLALSSVIIEANLKSGSLITANFCKKQNRLLFALPGNVDFDKSKGTNKLIKEGARLFENTEDILKHILPDKKLIKENKTTINPKLSGDEERILELLREESRHIDEIGQVLKMEIKDVSNLLLNLELNGNITQLPGKYYHIA